MFTFLHHCIIPGFSNCVSQSRIRWVAQSHLAVAKFAFQWHTVESRAARYTSINSELRYCLVRIFFFYLFILFFFYFFLFFFNHKGRNLKYELCVLKPGCALVAITEMVSEWLFIKDSVRDSFIHEKKLMFCMRLHKPENSNVTKTVSGMFIQFYIICLNLALTIFKRYTVNFLCLFKIRHIYSLPWG